MYIVIEENTNCRYKNEKINIKKCILKFELVLKL